MSYNELKKIALHPCAALWILTAFLAAPAGLQAGKLLEEYDFESVPAFLPNWGAGYSGTYKPATGWKEPFKVTLDSQNPHSGKKAVKVDYLEASSGKKILHTPAIVLKEGEDRTVEIQLYYRTENIGDENIQFQILQLDSDGSAFRYVETGKPVEWLQGSDKWCKVQFEGKVHNSARTLQLVWTVHDEKKEAALWLDDISVEVKGSSR